MPYSKLASVGATRELLDSFGLKAKYKLGQNFLVDDRVVGGILDLAQLDPTEAVMEVGPGIGTLTCALLPRVSAVVAIEADGDMRGPLCISCADYSERLALVQGDALRVTPQQVARALADLRAAGKARGGSPTRGDGDVCAAAPADPDDPAGLDLPRKVVANLPYQVAAKLILQWVQLWPWLDSLTVMIQAEVADRISAERGTKEYGAYTVKLGLLAHVTGRFEVSHASFFPAPHVESAVIRIDRLPADRILDPREARLASRVVDAAFAQRRKTLRNGLMRAGVSREDVDAACGDAGIDPMRRAETLDREEFIALSRQLASRTDLFDDPA